MINLKEVLSYATGTDVPDSFVRQVLEQRPHWDPVFRAQLEAYAYELYPELATWQITIDQHGRLREKRNPLI